MSLPDDFFVSTKIHERTVKLGDGTEHTVYFRELPSVDFRAFQISETSKDPGVKAKSMAQLISSSVCEPDGRPSLTRERAEMLKPAVTNELVARILEVNHMGADAAKKSSPAEAQTGSGTL